MRTLIQTSGIIRIIRVRYIKKDDKRERNLESPYAARDPTVRLITVLTSAAIKLFAKYFPNVKYSNISL